MSIRGHLGMGAALALAALALFAAFAIRKPPAVTAQAAIAVKASLDSCDKVVAGERLCKFDVYFDALPSASSYELTISSPAGDPLLTTPAQAVDSSFSVPYSGNGTYGIRVTAFGID